MDFARPVAYFSMEFAIEQPLKIYSGGLGFLAGSHMRSAFALKQNLVGIGMLWKYGYYDQERNQDNTHRVSFREKIYHFLTDTGVRFQLPLLGRSAWVHAYYLAPDVFGTAPVFLLTTDTDGNDAELRALSYQLYPENVQSKVAQCTLLGAGGARLLEEIGWEPEVYHLNEAHALPAAFYLYSRHGQADLLKAQLVFTTHTPEEAGNEKHDINFLEQTGFFSGVPLEEVRKLTGIEGTVFSHSLAALRLSRKANAVSELHGEVSRGMWEPYQDICEIIHITNAQHKAYWVDPVLEKARQEVDLATIVARKKELKQQLFRVVANQTGRLFSPDVLTIVWARRFAAYKRADLLTWDRGRFAKLLGNTRYPVQLIWAGKPYPGDVGAIQVFNQLHYLSFHYPNMAVLTGYELELSRWLKEGSDVWLNTPAVGREASGTSGMTAAMNASLNCSTYDGWFREFARDDENAFVIPEAREGNADEQDLNNLYTLLESRILPAYYEDRAHWESMMLTSMNDVGVPFDSDRMAAEYYQKLYWQHLL